MIFRTRLLSDTNTFVVVLVRVSPEGFNLSPLFPRCRSAERVGRVAVRIVISYKLLFVNKKLRPQHKIENSMLGWRKIIAKCPNQEQIVYVLKSLHNRRPVLRPWMRILHKNILPYIFLNQIHLEV